MISRRQFVAAGSLTVSAMGLGLGSASAQPASLIIDVHCHAFNAHDLPVRGFVQRVVFGDHEDTIILDPSEPVSKSLLPWVGALLIETLLTGAAPSAEQELRDIQNQRQMFARKSGDDPADDGVQDLAFALRNTLSLGMQNAFASAPEFAERATGQGGALFVDRLLKEAGIDGSAEAGDLPYEKIARGLLIGDGPISRHARWARLLNSPRRKIVEKMVDLYGGANQVRLFTPALVDFSFWLDDEPRSGFESQIRVMERIQRLQVDTPVHCFAAFDPWREVINVESGRVDTSLELVKWAISEMGFIGVKLYPPMGFLPAGNEGSGLRYPDRAATVPGFTKKIDDALDRLYSWAAAQGVPIMAHATNSNGAGEGFGGRASPKNWRPVLEKYPSLRLNLGHFGGFDESNSAGIDEKDWEDLFGELVGSGHDSLFADSSYLNEVLPRKLSQSKIERLRSSWAGFIDRHDRDVKHLMFGTDWLMLGQEAKHAEYISAVASFVQSVGMSADQRRRYMGANAARYLGLRAQEPARLRLEEYYRKHGLDDRKLTVFDDA